MKQLIRRQVLVAALAAMTVGTASAQQPSLPQNDPFYKPVTPKREAPKAPDKWVQVPYPSLEQRTAEYQQRRQAAKASGRAEPHPLVQYLVNELNVIGIYEIDGRLGVFVEATPTKATFFATPGTQLWNGQIVEIQPGVYPSPGRAVFRETTEYILRKQKKTDVQSVVKLVGQ